MTAVLDLAPHPGHPVAVVTALHEAIDGLEIGALSREELAPTIAALARARARLQALELRLLAAADRSGVADDDGCASTGAWVARQTRTGGARAARDVMLAVDLEDRLPSTRKALASGDVSREHAAVISHATSQLPRRLTADEVGDVEAALVEKATRVDPVQLRRLARRALAAVEDDTSVVDAHEEAGVRDEEQAALSRSRLTLHDNGDGTLTGHFTVPLLAGSILRRVLDSMTAPRRARTGATGAQGGRARDRDWAHERGLAFTQLLEHLPTDRLHGKVAATVVVTVDLETLRGRLKASGLDTGDLVSAAEARRLACQAGLVPAVLDGPSLPLDLGRASRLFTETQRVAGATRHSSCAADGCQTPYAWCELHHRHPWGPGGRTDLVDMVPLCGFHHRRVHDPDHLHERMPDGSVRFSRRT